MNKLDFWDAFRAVLAGILLLFHSVAAISASSASTPGPTPDCSPKAVVYFAERAPSVFQLEENGRLYGVRTHTQATRVDDMPGYNSCALVAHAILKKAGCRWAKRTANAKAIYDMAWRAGWRPSATQRAGCIVAWNARFEGSKARIGRGAHSAGGKKSGVSFRHVGISVGSWLSVDNSSRVGRPEAFITTRPFRYEPPMFICPPLE